MSTRRPPSISDRRLSAMLKRLRESPAAPQDFRARVLGRLAEDGLIPALAAAKPGWRGRLSAWLRPLPLGLAASCALALALVLRPAPPTPRPGAARPQAASPALAAAPAAEAPLAARPHPRPKALEAAPVQAQPAPELAAVQQPLQSQAPEAVGASAAPKAQSVMQAAGGAGVTATVGPEPRGGGKPFPTQGSEVRNNVVRVSQGQPADIHFSFSTPGHVRVDILDRLGREVAVLFDGVPQDGPGEYDGNGAAGAYPCPWCLWNNMTVNGDMAASGIYLVRVQTPDYVHIHKLMLIK